MRQQFVPSQMFRAPVGLALGGAVMWVLLTVAEAALEPHFLPFGAPEFILLSSGLRLLLFLVAGWPAALSIGLAAAGLAALPGGSGLAALVLAFLCWGAVPFLVLTLVRFWTGLDSRLTGMRRRHLVYLAVADTLAIAVIQAGGRWISAGSPDSILLISAVSNLLGILAAFAAIFIVLKRIRGTGNPRPFL